MKRDEDHEDGAKGGLATALKQQTGGLDMDKKMTNLDAIRKILENMHVFVSSGINDIESVRKGLETLVDAMEEESCIEDGDLMQDLNAPFDAGKACHA